ncbi:MAG TPA: GDSL-type esterase/lipase family protein [Sumerlaeia bacterium]|nr:GDSL-type esterase/lipase family protein [Sumerlaeia bacterium]
MRTDPLAKEILPGRRDFLKAGSLATAATVLGASASGAPSAPDETPRAVRPYPMIEKNDVILFQGDSITDAGRSREESGSPNNVGGMGRGYAALIAWQLLAERAGEGLKCYNRGVSGNKVPQLAARWQEDCIVLKPNVLSILIGVNDIWHKLGGNYDGTLEV